MSEHHFGVSRERLTPDQIALREGIARKHGAWFTCGDFPGEGFKAWFSKRNEGAPFDGATARAVLAEVAEAEGGAS